MLYHFKYRGANKGLTYLFNYVGAVFSSKCCNLEEQAVISLWYHNLPSLEEAVLSLLESVLTNANATPVTLQQQLKQSLLVGNLCCGFLPLYHMVRVMLGNDETNYHHQRCLTGKNKTVIY